MQKEECVVQVPQSSPCLIDLKACKLFNLGLVINAVLRVLDHVDAASNQLLVMFVETLCLERHLAAVRRTFLMEAGDLMTNFCDRLFHQIAAARITSGKRKAILS